MSREKGGDCKCKRFLRIRYRTGLPKFSLGCNSLTNLTMRLLPKPTNSHRSRGFRPLLPSPEGSATRANKKYCDKLEKAEVTSSL